MLSSRLARLPRRTCRFQIMQLTKQTDIALRVMVYVASHQERPQRITLPEIAKFYRISINQLRKVVHRLARQGFLSTAQGRGGGMRLAMPAASINLADLVEAMEDNLSIIDCAAYRCVLAGPCSLKFAINDAQQAFLDALRQYSLEAILSNRGLAARIVRLSLPTAA